MAKFLGLGFYPLGDEAFTGLAMEATEAASDFTEITKKSAKGGDTPHPYAVQIEM